MHFSGPAVTALTQANRDTLPDLCTVEVATRTAMPGGGAREQWGPVSDAHTDLPCRVSQFGAQNAGGPSERRVVDYTVALDGSPATYTIDVHHRLQVRSGPGQPVAFAMTLYVVAETGSQSLDPFPLVRCTTTPQPGQ